MLIEFGHFALILAFLVALVLGIVPLYGAAIANQTWMRSAKVLATLQFALIALAYAVLTSAFINNDFSVMYVANTSHTSMPLLYKVSGVWGGHEGSLLLWALMLSAWTMAVAAFSRTIPTDMIAQTLATLGFASVGFLAFILFTSNPFERLLPAPIQGNNLNPLLQDPGLAIHPPMLYMGYVGFAVPFAFAIAAMISGKIDSAWLRWVRPWAAVAFAFLTIGIALGSLWAYYELGWGGWWFWDPVENASLMPWLIGAALIHSLAVSEKRNTLKAWTLLLAILAFSLSLLGTFLVRSGVLTSVHAFASDPQRGAFILLYLCVVVGTSLALFAYRAPMLRSQSSFDPVSRETALLLNNVLLCVMTATVLLGTLYPLFMEAFNLGKISVGAPYFNAIMVPLGLALAVVTGIGILLRWKRDRFGRIQIRYLSIAALSLLGAWVSVALIAPAFQLRALIGLCVAYWVIFANIAWIIEQKARFHVIGPAIAHMGFAVSIIGITFTSLYSTEKDVRLGVGDRVEVAGFEFEFADLQQRSSAQYTSTFGRFMIRDANGALVGEVEPEKRVYPVQTMPMTEAGIDGRWTRDLFVALGEPLENNDWAVRIYHKPFIRLIWLGAVIIAFGAVLAIFDRRYFHARRSATSAVRLQKQYG